MNKLLVVLNTTWLFAEVYLTSSNRLMNSDLLEFYPNVSGASMAASLNVYSSSYSIYRLCIQWSWACAVCGLPVQPIRGLDCLADNSRPAIDQEGWGRHNSCLLVSVLYYIWTITTITIRNNVHALQPFMIRLNSIMTIYNQYTQN